MLHHHNFYPINLGILQPLQIAILPEQYDYYLSTYLPSSVTMLMIVFLSKLLFDMTIPD